MCYFAIFDSITLLNEDEEKKQREEDEWNILFFTIDKIAFRACEEWKVKIWISNKKEHNKVTGWKLGKWKMKFQRFLSKLNYIRLFFAHKFCVQ